MSQPFHRAMLMMAAIQAAMSLDVAGRAAAMGNIGTYQSRGKGRGNVTYASSGTNAQAQRAAIKAKNRKRNKARS